MGSSGKFFPPLRFHLCPLSAIHNLRTAHSGFPQGFCLCGVGVLGTSGMAFVIFRRRILPRAKCKNGRHSRTVLTPWRVATGAELREAFRGGGKATRPKTRGAGRGERTSPTGAK